MKRGRRSAPRAREAPPAATLLAGPVEVHALASSGEGVAREPSGRVLFARGGVPGDLARVRVVEEHKRFARAEIEEVVRQSPLRVEPRCAVHGACGGCGWQHVDYAAQLAAKRAQLEDALTRGAGFAPEMLPPLEVVRSPDPYATRSRARLLFAEGRVGYRRGRSHELVATERCPILVAPLERALAEIAAGPPRGGGELELACGDDGAVSVSGARVLGHEARAVALDAPGGAVSVSPAGFFQAHATLRRALAEAVLVEAGRGARALELHAGAGFFTLGLAAQFGELVAVESEPHAAQDLRANLARAERANVRVLAQRAARALASPELARFSPEVVVLDPPRTGIGESEAAALARLGAQRIVYVSCDPATFARDLRVLARGGYRLYAARGFDLFPHTPHVEALGTLVKS
jgi:23S rRNA (uracil1939-C5)-methyltransferase